MKRSIVSLAIATSTLAGVGAGATLLAPGLAGAQDGEAEAPSFDSFSDRLSEALQPLVDDGTITDSQRDAVVEHLDANRPERPGRRGRGGPAFGGDLAEILGMEPEELREALRDGDSLADIAAANGVDSQELVDAIVAAAEERVNGALEAGRINEDKAAEILSNAEQHAEDLVNGEIQPGGPGHRGPRGGFGPGGPGGEPGGPAGGPAGFGGGPGGASVGA